MFTVKTSSKVGKKVKPQQQASEDELENFEDYEEGFGNFDYADMGEGDLQDGDAGSEEFLEDEMGIEGSELDAFDQGPVESDSEDDDAT
jgi:hypothetical protein